MELVNVFLYFIFEACIFFSIVRLTYVILNRAKCELQKAELIIVWLIGTIIISSSVAGFFSFIQLNGVFQYLITVGLLVLAVHVDKRENLNQYFSYLVKTFDQLTEKFPNWKTLVIVAVIAPVFLLVIRPIDENDSVYVLSFMFEWINNSINPYSITAELPAFWELAFIPSILITNSDSFLWVTSFKPLFIIGLSSYLVGRKIGLPGRLSWLTAVTGCMFFILWFRVSGVSTLKNDPILTAGIILIALSIIKIIKGDLDKTKFFFFLAGISFVLVKYQGAAFVLIGIIFLIITYRKQITKINKKILVIFSVGILIMFFTTGHYYVHHFVETGNPFYSEFPTGENKLIEEVFKGKTSIVSNLDDERIFRYLLYHPSNIIKAGILSPLIITFGFLGTLGIILYSSTKFIQTRKSDSKILFLSLFIFLGWVLFYVTPRVVGNPADETFSFLESFLTMRYVTGTIILTEFLFIFFLWKLRIPQVVILTIIGIHLATRLFYLYGRIPPHVDLSLIIFPIVIVVALFLLRNHLWRLKIRGTIIICLTIIIFVTMPQIVEINRDVWFWYWNDAIMEVYYLPPSTIAAIDDLERPWAPPPTYPILGNEFQHTAVQYTYESLFQFLKTTPRDSISYPDYIFIYCNKHLKKCDDSTIEKSSQFNEFGYEMKFLGKRAFLLEFVETTKSN